MVNLFLSGRNTRFERKIPTPMYANVSFELDNEQINGHQSSSSANSQTYNKLNQITRSPSLSEYDTLNLQQEASAYEELNVNNRVFPSTTDYAVQNNQPEASDYQELDHVPTAPSSDYAELTVSAKQFKQTSQDYYNLKSRKTNW